MGAVYEATHARLAGRYAIKLLLLKPTVGSEAIALFAREARITSLLQHPNIVQVIDHNTTADGTEYLVMEYLAGESLAQRLVRKGPLPLDIVVGIVDQIAAGLAAAHASRVVHRDLKPDNVFLVPVEGREAESVKILDFGISKVKGKSWGRQAPEGTVMGTPLYMAPEQIEGRVGDADAATDQFALAVIAYEMLTGHTPFHGRHGRARSSRWCCTPIRRRWDSAATWSWWCGGAWPSRIASGFPPSRISPMRCGPRPPGGCAKRSGRRRSRTRPARSPATTARAGRDDARGGLALAAAVVASIAIAFVVGGEVNRRSSLVPAPSPPEPAADIPAAAVPE